MGTYWIVWIGLGWVEVMIGDAVDRRRQRKNEKPGMATVEIKECVFQRGWESKEADADERSEKEAYAGSCQAFNMSCFLGCGPWPFSVAYLPLDGLSSQIFRLSSQSIRLAQLS